MKILEVIPLKIPDIKVIRFARFRDNRGYFTETFRKSDMVGQVDIGGDFLQYNESYSEAKVLRGLHFQWNPYMGKLLRTLHGHMIDLVLDIRKGSPTYGKIIAYDISSESTDDTSEWIWVPPGFAHGNFFIKPTVIEYLCTGEYCQENEAAISALSPDLDWSLCEVGLKEEFQKLVEGSGLTISDKDRNAMSLADWTKDPRSENFVL